MGHTACHETRFSGLSGKPASSRYFYAPYFLFSNAMGFGKGFEGMPILLMGILFILKHLTSNLSPPRSNPLS